MLYQIAVAVVGFALIGNAAAASREQEESACRGDAIRLCASDIPNEAKITACMKAKLDQLTPNCMKMFTAPAGASGKGKARGEPVHGT